MTARFEGKIALITGAGSGMGRAIALRLAAEGASVLGVDVNAAGLAATAAAATGDLRTRTADLGDRSACVDELGGLDVLGNVAGIIVAAHTADMTVEQYRRVMAVNLDAPFFLCQAALPQLIERDGTIVNIASNAGLQGVPYAAAYCMSKGGLIQLTRSLAVELLKTRVRVNAIAPAGTNTALTAAVRFPEGVDPALMGRMAGHRGMAEPEEAAALFAFLASDEARSITGAVYTIDNGLTAS